MNRRIRNAVVPLALATLPGCGGALATLAGCGGSGPDSPSAHTGWVLQASITSGIRGAHAVATRDARTALAVGNRGEILATLDGGATAAKMDSGGATENLYGVSFS